MKKDYESPVVDVIEIVVEQGFAASLPDVDDGGIPW